MTAPPCPLGLSPLRANLQAAALLAVFYGHLYGNALLMGRLDGKLANPVVSVFITGALMLLVVSLLMQRDADWRASLGLQRTGLWQALAFGVVGIGLAYAANIVVLGLTLALRGGLGTQVTEKAQWQSKLADLPLAWVLPLSIFVGLWEETVFRGFLLGRLRVALHDVEGNPRARFARGMAVLITGVLFGAGHGYQGWLGLLQISAVGIALGWLTVWRKSLWPAIIAHLTLDTFGLVLIRVLKPKLEELLKNGLAQ